LSQRRAGTKEGLRECRGGLLLHVTSRPEAPWWCPQRCRHSARARTCRFCRTGSRRCGRRLPRCECSGRSQRAC